MEKARNSAASEASTSKLAPTASASTRRSRRASSNGDDGDGQRAKAKEGDAARKPVQPAEQPPAPELLASPER